MVKGAADEIQRWLETDRSRTPNAVIARGSVNPSTRNPAPVLTRTRPVVASLGKRVALSGAFAPENFATVLPPVASLKMAVSFAT